MLDARIATESPSEFKTWAEMTRVEQQRWADWDRSLTSDQVRRIYEITTHLVNDSPPKIRKGMSRDAFDAAQWLLCEEPHLLELDDQTIVANIRRVIEAKLMEEIL